MNQKTQSLHALIPDSESTLSRYAATMSKWRKGQSSPKDIQVDRHIATTLLIFFSVDGYTIDIVKDVINPVCIQWVCQTLVSK